MIKKFLRRGAGERKVRKVVVPSHLNFLPEDEKAREFTRKLKRRAGSVMTPKIFG